MSKINSASQKEAEYLARLRDYYAAWKSIPSYATLCKVFGVASKSWVKAILERLAESGFLERTPDGVWVPSRQFFSRPLVDAKVPAGMPISVSDSAGEALIIDELLVDVPSKTVLIPVKGNSMVDAGIFDGDIAVVEKRNVANVGDIVVAIVDGEFTLKTLDREGEGFVLRPQNSAYPVIRAQGSLEIFGVLVGLVRKYRN